MDDPSAQRGIMSRRKALRPIHFVIVGGGIAGLTAGLGLKMTGHQVTILEQAAHFHETGAGIQIAPNAARVLDRFGVLEDVLKDADILERISVRRYADDEELASVPVMPAAGQRYGAPVLVIHRGDLQRILLAAARKAGCIVKTGQKAIGVDAGLAPRVYTANGCFAGDVVLGADGIRSAVRGHIVAACGQSTRLTPTGDAAYRVLIPRERLTGHKRLLELVDSKVAMRWLGPGGHVMAYPIKHHSLYNVVILHPTGPEPQTAVTTTKRRRADALEFYRHWSGLVRELLSWVPEGEVTEWMLYKHASLTHWVKDRVALLGDSCHPMLPYTAQGAANAIEDAGALVAAFTCTASVDLALGVYQEVRKARSDELQTATINLRTCLHLPDGEEQRRRDDAIRCAIRDFDRGQLRNPDLWVDRRWQDFTWGVDVIHETVHGWDDLAARVEAQRARCRPAAEQPEQRPWQSRGVLCT